MIKTFEAVLSLAIVIGAVTLALSPPTTTTQDINPLRESGENALLAAAAQEAFRSTVAGASTASDANVGEAFLSPFLSHHYALRICPVGAACFGNLPNVTNTTVVNYHMDGNSTLHAPRKLKLYLWVLTGGG